MESTSLEYCGMLDGRFEVRGLFGAASLDRATALKIGIEDASKKLCETNSVEVSHKSEESANAEQKSLSTVELWEVAKTVYDPEIPVNIVDLGLVYGIDLRSENGANVAVVDMTLTAPGCSLGPVIANDLKEKLESLPSVSEAHVNIVWEPPWNQDMMTLDARMILGLE